MDSKLSYDLNNCTATAMNVMLRGWTCEAVVWHEWLWLLHRYDDLRNYNNERSIYLAQLRHSIEQPWQQWETAHFDVDAYKSKSVEEVLIWQKTHAAMLFCTAHGRSTNTIAMITCIREMG